MHTYKRIPPSHPATQCISGMKTVLRGAGFRQWELPEFPHWGKAQGIPSASALQDPRERIPECRQAENAVPCREGCRSKRCVRRQQIDAFPKGRNNPECRRVVPAEERLVSTVSARYGMTYTLVSSETPKRVYKTDGRPK